jgi:hypothetical protein
MMKNLLKFSLLVAVVLTNARTYASGTDFSLLVEKENVKTTTPNAAFLKPTLVYKEGIVTLSILNFESVSVDVIIYDEYHNEVFNDTFTGKQDFFKKFDVSKISKGNYTFEINYNNKIFVQTISTN